MQSKRKYFSNNNPIKLLTAMAENKKSKKKNDVTVGYGVLNENKRCAQRVFIATSSVKEVWQKKHFFFAPSNVCWDNENIELPFLPSPGDSSIYYYKRRSAKIFNAQYTFPWQRFYHHHRWIAFHTWKIYFIWENL